MAIQRTRVYKSAVPLVALLGTKTFTGSDFVAHAPVPLTVVALFRAPRTLGICLPVGYSLTPRPACVLPASVFEN